MTLYFTSALPSETNRFTVSIPNAPTDLGIWTLSLRSELTHVSPVLQAESQLGMDLSIVPLETNDRYTTFKFTNNYTWAQMRQYLKNGIYYYRVGIKEDDLNFVEYIKGVAKVITQASLEPSKEIIKYNSNNEDNSGFVYYSDTL